MIGQAYEKLIKTEKRSCVLNPEEDDERTILQSVKRQRTDDSSEIERLSKNLDLALKHKQFVEIENRDLRKKASDDASEIECLRKELAMKE